MIRRERSSKSQLVFFFNKNQCNPQGSSSAFDLFGFYRKIKAKDHLMKNKATAFPSQGAVMQYFIKHMLLVFILWYGKGV